MPTRVIAGQAALEAFCRRYRIRCLSLFGFILKRTARPDCGVDLLAEVEPGATPGPLTMIHIEIDMSESLGKGPLGAPPGTQAGMSATTWSAPRRCNLSPDTSRPFCRLVCARGWWGGRAQNQ